MQSPPSKHKTRKKPKTSGEYYKFSWGDQEYSTSDDDDDVTLSPKEYVSKILLETELSNLPIISHEIGPELDLSFDFLPEVTSVASDDTRPDILELDELHISPSSYDDDCFGTDTPGTLESPLDHPDSGYIEFVMSPSSSSSLEQTRSHSDGLGSSDLHSDYDSVSSDDVRRQRAVKAKDRHKRKSSESFLPAIRFRKANFERLEEDMYIEDDVHTSYMCTMPPASGRHIVTPIDYTSNTTSLDGDRGYLDLEMPDIDVTDRLGDPMLDSDIDDDQPETEMEDTNPIILVEQGKLTQQWRRKRKRIKIAVGVLAIVFGLAALAAIIYLLVRFLVLA